MNITYYDKLKLRVEWRIEVLLDKLFKVNAFGWNLLRFRNMKRVSLWKLSRMSKVPLIVILYHSYGEQRISLELATKIVRPLDKDINPLFIMGESHEPGVHVPYYFRRFFFPKYWRTDVWSKNDIDEL